MKIGFIGAGQMARALANGFVRAGLVQQEDLSASDCAAAARRSFHTGLPGADVRDDNRAIVERAEVIFVAVKPQQVQAVWDELPAVPEAKLIVSIVAGLSIQRLAAGLKTQRIIRVMPNTPCLVAQGAAAYSLGPGATPADAQTVQSLLEAVGIAFQLPENLLDAVTGLSGSGPAFVFQLIEALADGGVRVGLPRDVAQQLATQTVRGAAEMIAVTGEHPAVLKDRVASPGGTTIAGLHELERGAFRSLLISAVEAATNRSIHLGKG